MEIVISPGTVVKTIKLEAGSPGSLTVTFDHISGDIGLPDNTIILDSTDSESEFSVNEYSDAESMEEPVSEHATESVAEPEQKTYPEDTLPVERFSDPPGKNVLKMTNSLRELLDTSVKLGYDKELLKMQPTTLPEKDSSSSSILSTIEE